RMIGQSSLFFCVAETPRPAGIMAGTEIPGLGHARAGEKLPEANFAPASLEAAAVSFVCLFPFFFGRSQADCETTLDDQVGGKSCRSKHETMSLGWMDLRCLGLQQDMCLLSTTALDQS